MSQPPTVSSSAEADRNRNRNRNRNGQSASGPVFSLRGAVWPLLLSLAVLGVIGYYTFDLGAFRQFGQSVNIGLLAAGVGVAASQVVFGGWRLHVVSNRRLGLAPALPVQLAWHFFSVITPSTVGGGPPAAYYMARDQPEISVGEATALMLFTLLLDQLFFAFSIPLLFLAAAYVEVFPSALGAVGTGAAVACFVGLLAWAALFAYTMLFRPDLLERVADRLFRLRLLRRFRGRVMPEMHRLRRHAKRLRLQPPGFYAKGLLLTAGFWVGRVLLAVLIIWSVYASLDVVLAFVRSAAMTFGSLLLPTPGGAGGLEGLYVLFLGPLMPESLVAPTLLTWRVLGYYVFIPLGVYLSAHHVQKTLRRRRSNGEDEPAPAGDAHPARPVSSSK